METSEGLGAPDHPLAGGGGGPALSRPIRLFMCDYFGHSPFGVQVVFSTHGLEES